LVKKNYLEQQESCLSGPSLALEHEPDCPHPPHPHPGCLAVKDRKSLLPTKKAAMATMATTMTVSSIWIPPKFLSAALPDIHLIVMLRIKVKNKAK
jgi:hypothetical protein